VSAEKAKDMAEYNRLLAEYFSRTALSTKDGGNGLPPVEPPSYDEWVAAGKPLF
jgi:hypothetical protein